MRVITTTVVFLLLFAGLCFYTIQVVPIHIESSIQSDIEQQFSRHNLSTISINVDGRDVTLAGQVDKQDKIDQAITLATNRSGVRVLMTKIVVTADNAAVTNNK